MYTAGLIVIGDEILRGQIVDTNTSYLAQQLRATGVKLRKVTVVPDIVRISNIFYCKNQEKKYVRNYACMHAYEEYEYNDDDMNLILYNFYLISPQWRYRLSRLTRTLHTF